MKQELTEEARRRRAKGLRYRKPVVQGITWDDMLTSLSEIQDTCCDILWDWDHDEAGTIEALCGGDSDEAGQFKVEISDLESEVEQMYEDLHGIELPEHWDDFFVGIGKNTQVGNVLGWDEYECDYYPLDHYDINEAAELSRERLMRLSKSDILLLTGKALKIYTDFISLKTRYDCLSAAVEILKDGTTHHLHDIKELNDAYEDYTSHDSTKSYEGSKRIDRIIQNLPPEAWLA